MAGPGRAAQDRTRSLTDLTRAIVYMMLFLCYYDASGNGRLRIFQRYVLVRKTEAWSGVYYSEQRFQRFSALCNRCNGLRNENSKVRSYLRLCVRAREILFVRSCAVRQASHSIFAP